MPRIKLLRFRAPNVIETHLCYHTRNEQLYVCLPDDIMEFAEASGKYGVERVGIRGKSPRLAFVGDKEDPLIRTIRGALEEYQKRSKVVNKMILLHINCQSRNIDGAHRWGDDDYVEIQFDYSILEVHDVGGAHSYYNIKPDGEIEYRRYGIDDDDLVIPWSKENEEFCARFYAALENLIRNMQKFLGTKKAILNFIKSKKALLSLPASTGKG